MEKVVCAVDDSDGAKDAARAAAFLAGRLEWPLALVHIEQPPPRSVAVSSAHADPVADSGTAGPGEPMDLLAGLAAELGLEQPAELLVGRGEIPERIRSIAAREHAGLLVVGSRGRGLLASALFGTVSGSVAAAAACPVLVVPPGRRLTEGTIVAGVDGSDASREAARVALALSRRLRAELLLTHVFSPRPIPGSPAAPKDREALVEAERDRARKLIVEVATECGIEERSTRLVAGWPEAGALSSLATAEQAAMVVVGSRGRGGVKSALLGSVSFELTRAAPCPVVVVPPEAGRSFGSRVAAE